MVAAPSPPISCDDGVAANLLRPGFRRMPGITNAGYDSQLPANAYQLLALPLTDGARVWGAALAWASDVV